MKRWIHAATSKDDLLSDIKKGCEYLGIDAPVDIRKKGSGYKLIFKTYDQFDRPIDQRYDLHDKYTELLGYDWDDDKNTYQGNYREFLAEKSRLVNEEYDKMFDDIGIRFKFTKQGDDLYLPDQNKTEDLTAISEHLINNTTLEQWIDSASEYVNDHDFMYELDTPESFANAVIKHIEKESRTGLSNTEKKYVQQVVNSYNF